MRAWQIARLVLVGLALTAYGCDDEPGATTPIDMTPAPDSGGAGGEGGGGAGGEGGTGGAVDMGPDMGPCTCGEADCADDDCVEPPTCEGDEACRGSRICEIPADGDGTCVEGCADDMACAGTPDTPVCVEGRCGNCRDDDDCFGGSTCSDERRCVAPATCEASRECVGDDQCVAGSDTCEPAFRCDAEGATCPGEFTCDATSGACRPVVDDDCDSDAQCPYGQVCLTFPRQCGACASDDDCPGDQLCASGANGGRCVEPSVCDGDDDCVGGRTCDGNRCAPPACTPDAFEGNDQVATAAAITGDRVYRGLTSCGSDWYSLEVPADTQAAFVLRQHDRDVDLDLAFANAEGALLRTASTGLATERLVADARPSARTVYVVVQQNGPESVGGYDLQIDFSSPADCRDDAYEFGGGDDTFETARIVRGAGEIGFTEPVTGRICPGDVDYVCFYQGISELLAVNGSVAGDAVLTAELLRYGRDNVRETGTWSLENTQPIVDAEADDGLWCLRLSAESGSGTYTLDLSAYTLAMNLACQDTTPLPLSDGSGSADGELGRNGLTTPLCAGNANTGEVIYAVEVDAPRLLTARVTGLGTGRLGDPVVSVRQDCRVAASEMACAAATVRPEDPYVAQANPVVLRAPLTEPGTYYVFVDGIDAIRDADYRLDVETVGLAAPPENERCEDAMPLDLSEGFNQFDVNLDQAKDDLQGCFGQGGADVTYQITLDAPARLRLDTLAQPDAFAVGAYLLAACGAASPSACGFGFDEVLPAGEYVLVVDGIDPSAIGRVVVRIEKESFPAAPGNDTCGGATALDGPTGAVDGDTRGAGDDYQLAPNNACTGYATVAPDVTFRLPVRGGERTYVHAEPAGGWDLSLYVVPDCDALDQDCRGQDGALGESVVWTPDADGDVFVVVDGANGEAGPFELRWGPAECENDAECGEGRCVQFACEAQ